MPASSMILVPVKGPMYLTPLYLAKLYLVTS